MALTSNNMHGLTFKYFECIKSSLFLNKTISLNNRSMKNKVAFHRTNSKYSEV